jgi:hypothetical protein
MRTLSCLGILLSASSLAAQQSCFDDSGGPGGDFDWVVESGQIFFFDTTLTPVTGGPNGVPTTVQNAVDGVVSVRNLIIEPGGEIRALGPNRMLIQASGDVIIRGKLDVSGFNAKDVATLNTGNQFELGGAGGPGAGSGGLGNPVITGSSPGGTRGKGPGNAPDVGGGGGESGFAPAGLGKNARRPGGGGGGRFARDQGTGLEASAGNDGSPMGTGAVSGLSPAAGGMAGVGPFVDAREDNDFYGVRPVLAPGGSVIGLLRGELRDLHAGYGGGGGGNAIPASSFPNPNWTFSTDEKGGGGGGGGGALHIQALGRIVFGLNGQILANGGFGALGENTNFLDHVGGTGGAGSGGHVVLESLTEIDFTDGGLNQNAAPRDWIAALGKPKKTGPLQFVDPCCREFSNGGAGGPGVVQLHVPRAAQQPNTNGAVTNIVVPDSVAMLVDPLDGVSSPAAYLLYPTCNPLSALPLEWLPTKWRLFGMTTQPDEASPQLFSWLARKLSHAF